MFGECCKTCKQNESEHRILADLDLSPEEINARYSVQDKPCDNFESQIEHKPGCPIVLDDPSDLTEVYCQDLEDGCAELLDMDAGLIPFPD